MAFCPIIGDGAFFFYSQIVGFVFKLWSVHSFWKLVSYKLVQVIYSYQINMPSGPLDVMLFKLKCLKTNLMYKKTWWCCSITNYFTNSKSSHDIVWIHAGLCLFYNKKAKTIRLSNSFFYWCQTFQTHIHHKVITQSFLTFWIRMTQFLLFWAWSSFCRMNIRTCSNGYKL